MTDPAVALAGRRERSLLELPSVARMAAVLAERCREPSWIRTLVAGLGRFQRLSGHDDLEALLAAARADPTAADRSLVGFARALDGQPDAAVAGLAMGAKLAAPAKTVVNIMGDAAFGMAGMDIETAARSGIGTLTIIFNNGVMTHYHAHFPHAAERWGSNKLGGHYAKVAEGLGAYAARVETPDQVGPAIQHGLAATKTGKPAVLEMITQEEETIPRYWR